MSARFTVWLPAMRRVIATVLVMVGVAVIGRVLIGAGVLWSPSTAVIPPVAIQLPVDRRPGGSAPDSLIVGAEAAPRSDDGVIGFLTIPRLGLHAVPIFDRGLDAHGNMLVATGFSATHYRSSAPLGAGNAVLYGHDDIEGGVFAHLANLQPGDEVDVAPVGSQKPLIYRVVAKNIVNPSALGILQPTSEPSLTLFTCWPTWVDTRRVVVTAIAA
jgi:LPXTG-site transpeptidase (sortase) family protein